MGFTGGQTERAVDKFFGEGTTETYVLDYVLHDVAHWFSFKDEVPWDGFETLRECVGELLTQGAERHDPYQDQWLYGRELVALAAHERIGCYPDDSLIASVGHQFMLSPDDVRRDMERMYRRQSVEETVRRMSSWLSQQLIKADTRKGVRVD